MKDIRDFHELLWIFTLDIHEWKSRTADKVRDFTELFAIFIHENPLERERERESWDI